MTNQLTTNNTHIANAPEEELKMTNKITCKRCGIEMIYHNTKRDTLWPQITYIVVRNADGAYLGNIYSADPAEDWEKIANGACPICDEWEDGHGHVCNPHGWELSGPNFATDHGVANLIDAGWTADDRDELKEEYNMSDFEADAYIEVIKEF